MAYSEQNFKAAYERAVQIRVGVDPARGVVPKTKQAAWELYENTRTATLGLQVFGRHKKNASDFGGEPGIELYGEVFPRQKKKRFLGLYSSPETTKEWESRVRKAGYLDQMKDPKGRQRSPMEFNFGIVSNKNQSLGSILMMGNELWNLNINDAWVTGGVHSHQPFYLAFTLSYNNIFDDSYKHNLTITGRELLGLLCAGYELETHTSPKTGDVVESVMVCRKPAEADNLTLDEYSLIAQTFEGPMDVNKMDVIAPMKNVLPPDLLDKYRASVARADELRNNFVTIARCAKVNLS